MRWTPIIVRNLLLGCETFNELREGAPGIPRTLLSERLRLLEHYGVVERSGRRYLLTPAGRELEDVVDALGTWGARWLEVAPEHLDSHLVLWSLCRLADAAAVRARDPLRSPRRAPAALLGRARAAGRRGVRHAARLRRGPGRPHDSETAREVAHGPDLARPGDARRADERRRPGPTSSRRSPRSGSAASPTSSLGSQARALQQQFALARVAGQRRGALELGARLVGAAELGQQVRAHARQQVVVAQRRLVEQLVDVRAGRPPARTPCRARRRG